MIKKSTTDDKERIQQLMQLCFGDNNKIDIICILRIIH